MHLTLAVAALLLILRAEDAASYAPLQTSQPEIQPNEITYVDLRPQDNAPRHHTIQYGKQYDFNHPLNPVGPSLVLRRGESLNVIMHLRQGYNATTHQLRIELHSGAQPQLDKGTLYYLPLEKDLRNSTSKSGLSATLIDVVRTNQLNVRIYLPPSMPIGVWRLKVSSKPAGTRNVRTYTVNRALCIIFNPWNKDDATFLAREDARQEYVLNEVGKIYIGSESRPTGRKWTYGQFHEAVLPAVMYMLDKTRLDIAGRSDVVRVARAVSAMVNSHDDNGFLVGNWSGSYGDGLAPWQWTSSAVIFDRFLRHGCRPVKFGQCWVFGGVTTTALRTLGIPARTITNFVSAHDTDFSLTVDKFYSERGEQLSGINGDSIWNFHVWSDAWMARHDLPPGFGGWQAIDATPQERSMNQYQLGPASLEAIKQGKVGYAYDVGFVYSEINADLVHWRYDPHKPLQWRKVQVHTSHVGRKMLTKAIGVLDERSSYGIADAEDIFDQYKYREGSPEERRSYAEATRTGGLKPVLDNR